MILVLLGTQNNDFSRLLKEVEKNIENKIINEEVIAQVGFTKYESDKMETFDEISSEKMEELIERANYIITHAGVGSITDSLRKGKKVIAVPRLQKYGEHVNNHQLDIIQEFNEKGYIIGISDVSELGDAIKKINDFKPNKYEGNSNNIIKIIENFIG